MYDIRYFIPTTNTSHTQDKLDDMVLGKYTCVSQEKPGQVKTINGQLYELKELSNQNKQK